MGAAVTVLAAGWGLHRWREQQAREEDGSAAPSNTDSDLRAVERRALTRELHQVVTHHLSTAALQVMSYLDATDADELRGILARVNLSLQAALTELRQLARMQREDPSWRSAPGCADELSAPVPPSTAAARWARRLTEAGYPVTLDVATAADRLRISTQATLAAALEAAGDDVLRHATVGSPCDVVVAVGADEVVLRVRSRLAAPPREGAGAARGLRRLRERVDLSGGSMVAGPEAAAQQPGTWLVEVVLPR